MPIISVEHSFTVMSGVPRHVIGIQFQMMGNLGEAARHKYAGG